MATSPGSCPQRDTLTLAGYTELCTASTELRFGPLLFGGADAFGVVDATQILGTPILGDENEGAVIAVQ